jgi:hypothetical protein
MDKIGRCGRETNELREKERSVAYLMGDDNSLGRLESWVTSCHPGLSLLVTSQIPLIHFGDFIKFHCQSSK